MKLSEILADFPMIAAVRNEEDLRECFKTQCRIIFIVCIMGLKPSPLGETFRSTP